MKSIWTLFITLLVFSELSANALTWATMPTTISISGTDSSDPHVAMDPNGNSVAVWVQNNVINASTLLLNGTWTSPVVISNSVASSPRLAVDNNGNAVAIWLENGIVSASNYTFSSSTWSAEVAISSSTATSPALAVQSNGNAVAVWVLSSEIQAATQIYGMSWVAASGPISSTPASNPSVAVGNNGTVVAVWHITISNNDQLQSSSATSVGGTFATPINVLLVAPGYNHNYPKVAVDSNGNAIVVWFRYNYQNPAYLNVVALTSSLPSSAASWSPIPTVLSQNLGLLNPATLSLRVGFDGTGNAGAVWNSSFDGETLNVESSIRAVNGQWTTTSFAVFQNLYALSADFANTTIGDNLGVFMYYDGTSVNILSSESNDNGYYMQNPWLYPFATISQGTDNAYPRCAASITGGGTTKNAVAVWIGYDSSNNVIMASSGSKTVISPPTPISPVTQNEMDFKTFQDYYNTLNWSASPSSGITAYAIYRDGVYVTSVSPSTLQYIDHNQLEDGPVTYGIATIGSLLEHSEIATINYP